MMDISLIVHVYYTFITLLSSIIHHPSSIIHHPPGISTIGEGWNCFMDGCAVEPPLCTITTTYNDCGSLWGSRVYFIIFFFAGQFTFLMLFVAVVLANFGHFVNVEDAVVAKEVLERCGTIWAMFDPEQTGYIKITKCQRCVDDG